jgi:hypothetical protein
MEKNNKKGVIEIQFNWIFIMIIGGIILVLFLSLVAKQKKVTDVKICSIIKTDLRSILTGAKVSTGTAQLIDKSDIDITFDCQGYTICNLEPIKPRHSFSPQLIKERQLMAWAYDWSIPYRITNFIYITSPLVRYIIVNDSGSLAEQLNESMPPELILEEGSSKFLISKEVLSDFNTLKDKNNYKVKFVYFNNSDNNFLEYDSNIGNLKNKDKDISAVKIVPIEGGIDGFGKIYFYNKYENSWSLQSDPTYYIGKASLIAAVFSEDIETYNCNMQIAFEDLSLITSIYLNRTMTLYNIYNKPPTESCASKYDTVNSILQNILDNALRLSSNFPDENQIQNIYNKVNSELGIIKLNDEIQKLSCAEVY